MRYLREVVQELRAQKVADAMMRERIRKEQAAHAKELNTIQKIVDLMMKARDDRGHLA